jgi:hypothetical protein
MVRQPSINVDFITDSHRITCRVEIGATGLIGVLNNVHASLVDVEAAYVSRLQDPAKIVGNFEIGSLNKSNVVLAIVAKKESLGPQAFSSGGYKQLLPCPVIVTTAAFEIRGEVEVPGKLDANALLMGQGGGKFMPLFRAKIVATHYSEAPALAADAMLINRTLVSAFAAIARGKA